MDGAPVAHRDLKPDNVAPVEKMVRAYSDRDVLAALVAKAEPRLRRKFLEIVANLKDRRGLAEIAEMIREHRVLDMLDDARAAGAELAEAINAVYLLAAKQIAAEFTAAGSRFVAFDQASPRVIQALQREGAKWVREITEQQRQIIVDVVGEGIQLGRHPRVSARQIKQSIGLTARQHDHVKSYRRALETLDSDALDRALRDARFDRTVKAAIKSGKPLTKAQIDKMTARYQQRYVAFRAQTIAQTEAIAAAHRGQDEIWTQAIERGDLEAERVECGWVPGPSRKHRRDFHQSMRGQKRAWGVPFTSGLGNSIPYPHAPGIPAKESLRCACARVVRLLPRRAVAAVA